MPSQTLRLITSSDAKSDKYSLQPRPGSTNLIVGQVFEKLTEFPWLSFNHQSLLLTFFKTILRKRAQELKS